MPRRQYITPTFQKTTLYWLKELQREVEAKELGPYQRPDLERLDQLLEETKVLVVALRT